MSYVPACIATATCRVARFVFARWSLYRFGPIVLMGSLLAGCGSDPVTVAGNEPSASLPAPLPAYRAGDRFVFDNPAEVWTVVAVEGPVVRWRNDRGDSETRFFDPILPPTEWAGPTNGTGRRDYRYLDGELFPLARGRRVEFGAAVQRDGRPNAVEDEWTCWVERTSAVGSPIGRVATFVVPCEREGRWAVTYHYAPALQHHAMVEFPGEDGGTVVRRLTQVRRSDGTEVAVVDDAPRPADEAAAPASAPARASLLADTQAAIDDPRRQLLESVMLGPPRYAEIVGERPMPARPLETLVDAVPVPPVAAEALAAADPATAQPPAVHNPDGRPVPASPVAAPPPPTAAPAPQVAAEPRVQPAPRRPVTREPASPLRGNVPVASAPPPPAAQPPAPRPARTPPQPSAPSAVAALPPPPVPQAAGVPQPAAPRATPSAAAQGPLQVPRARATAPAAAARGAALVHLASYLTRDAAERGWATLLEQYGDVLSGASPDIETVTLPGQGEVFRLRARLGSASAASRVCETLEARGASCRTLPVSG